MNGSTLVNIHIPSRKLYEICKMSRQNTQAEAVKNLQRIHSQKIQI